jgi:hypothetical protein
MSRTQRLRFEIELAPRWHRHMQAQLPAALQDQWRECTKASDVTSTELTGSCRQIRALCLLRREIAVPIARTMERFPFRSGSHPTTRCLGG